VGDIVAKFAAIVMPEALIRADALKVAITNTRVVMSNLPHPQRDKPDLFRNIAN
jgi:hypothetical protein